MDWNEFKAIVDRELEEREKQGFHGDRIFFINTESHPDTLDVNVLPDGDIIIS